MDRRLQPRHLALAGLVIAAAGWLAMFRYDAYGLEEAGAHALVLDWTIAHHVITPVAAYGFPDLRALVLAPLDLHWAGSLAAAKVWLMLLWFGCVLLVHAETRRLFGDEAAMIAAGLLVVSPLAVHEADRIGAGIFLTTALALAPALWRRLETAPRLASVWMLLLWFDLAVAASVHPAGLGALAAFAWHLRGHLRGDRKAQLALAGAAVLALVAVASRLGWPGLEGPFSPFEALGALVLGPKLVHPAPRAWAGSIPATLLLLLAPFAWREARAHLWPAMLAGAWLAGLAHPDPAWALLSAVLLLALGTPALIAAHERIPGRSFAAKRGGVLAAVFLVATGWMLLDKQYALAARAQTRQGPDRVIAALAEAMQDARREALAASAWPARSVLATRRPVLPLPPAAGDPEAFRRSTRGLDYLAFDPYRNKALARVLAMLPEWKTVRLLPEGVVLMRERPGGTRP